MYLQNNSSSINNFNHSILKKLKKIKIIKLNDRKRKRIRIRRKKF